MYGLKTNGSKIPGDKIHGLATAGFKIGGANAVGDKIRGPAIETPFWIVNINGDKIVGCRK